MAVTCLICSKICKNDHGLKIHMGKMHVGKKQEDDEDDEDGQEIEIENGQVIEEGQDFDEDEEESDNDKDDDVVELKQSKR